MKPFNLADVNQFEIETNAGLITLLLPREGGQPARLEIVEAALPRLLMTLIAASTQLREHVGPLPPPSENPPEGRVLMPPIDVEVVGSPERDGHMTIRAGRIDFRFDLSAGDFKALRDKINNG